MSDQHTPGPWVDDGYAHIGAVNDQLNGGYFIALCEGPDRVANARRIVACVNACAGIPSDMLEAMPSGPVSLLPMYARIEKQRDDLLAAAENVLRDKRGEDQWLILSVHCRQLEEVIAKVKGAA